MKRTILGLFAALLVATSFSGLPASATYNKVVYFVNPHPDDEFQMWSQVERATDAYRIFVYLTSGEEEEGCEPSAFDKRWQRRVEAGPAPIPTGRWTESCIAARQNALVGFFNTMGTIDPKAPFNFSFAGSIGPLPDAGVDICRKNQAPAKQCSDQDLSATVWQDSFHHSAIVMFNLGDGDLTEAETIWAMNQVIERRATILGVPDAQVATAKQEIFSAYANPDRSECFIYPHPDHLALAKAMWEHDFGVGPQYGATCRTDPRAKFRSIVRPEVAHEAFLVVGRSQRRLGPHPKYFSWMHDEWFPLGGSKQDEIFHSSQWFWERP